MSLDHLLDGADPRDAAEAAVIMANATVDDDEASENERSNARELIDLGVDELERRFQREMDEEIALTVENAGRQASAVLSRAGAALSGAEAALSDPEALIAKYDGTRLSLPGTEYLIGLGLHKDFKNTVSTLAGFSVSGVDVWAVLGDSSAGDVGSEGALGGPAESAD